VALSSPSAIDGAVDCLPPLVVWRLCDGKRGHDNQSLGLARALARLTHTQIESIPAPSFPAAARDFVRGRLAYGKALAPPGVVIGAGRATHPGLIAARRATGARAVVLMRPSLPYAWFDLALIPQHDAPPSRANVEPTMGALNVLVPDAAKDELRGMILIGGPSKHYGWNERSLIDQLRAIIGAGRGVHWTIADSRRTPPGTRVLLRKFASSNIRYIADGDTTPDWLPGELERSHGAWVSADSVSMVYEALSAGCAVGLIDVPQIRAGRVTRGTARLVEEAWVTPFTRWREDGQILAAGRILRESERCAELILQRFFPERPRLYA
jgi:hypothetical protein